MSNKSVLSRRGKTIGENILIVLLIAVLMAMFIYYFFKQEKQLTQVGFEAIANNFAANVTAIRAQWFMDGQPKQLLLKEKNATMLMLPMNKQGWVDSINAQAPCISVWKSIMASELVFMNQPIIVVEIINEENSQKNSCRYSLASGERFDYQPKTGKVSEVTMSQ